MAITFIAASHIDTSGSTTLTPAEPTGAQQNDLIIAYGKWRDTGAAYTITDPADFTQIDQFYEAVGSADDVLYVGYKIRGADEGSGYQFSVGTSDAGQFNLLCYRGVDTATPFDVTYVKASHYDADGSPGVVNNAAQPITTVTDNAWVVLLYLNTQNHSSSTGGPPSGYTEDQSVDLNFAIDGAYACHKEASPAGLETPGVYTHTDTNDTDDPRLFTFALKPTANFVIEVPLGPLR